MAQYEVLNFLKEHPNNWWSVKEITKELNNVSSKGSIGTNLMKLRKARLVYYKEIKEKFRPYTKMVYKHKR